MKVAKTILFKSFMLIVLLGIANTSKSQQIIVSGLYSSSTSIQFKTNAGYEIGYNQNYKRHHLGLFLSNQFNDSQFDYSSTSTCDGITQYIREYHPNNRRTSIHLLYGFNLMDREKSNLSIGFHFGLNYYHLQGYYEELKIDHNNDLSEDIISYNYNIDNKLAYGVNIEYEIKEVISKRISTFIRATSDLSWYKKSGCLISRTPYDIAWMNINIGLKYHLKI